MTTKTKLLILAGLSAFAIAPLTYAATCSACSSDSSYSTKAKDLVAVASSNESFTTLVAAVKAAGLVDTLQGDGPFTIFAPTDEAFAALPAGTVESLLKAENRDQLIAILTYHVVPAKVMAADVKSGKAPTVNGSQIEVKVKDGTVMINDATVLTTDVMASNGVIHVIDRVILPPAPAEVSMK